MQLTSKSKTASTFKLLFLAAVVAISTSAQAITISTSPASSDSYNSWTWQTLGSIALAEDSGNITALHSTVTLVDQGWGGEDPNNGVYVVLFDNGANIWYQHVAGASHTWSTQTYDADLLTLSALNTAMSSINWGSSPTVSLGLYAVPIGYPGWELHTVNSSFSITTNVPDSGTTVAILGFAFIGVVGLRRKFATA